MDMAEKHARMLSALGEFGLNLAREMHDRALAAEEPQVAADLARAFHAVSQTLRQTILLETRVVRDVEQRARQDREMAEKAARAPIAARRLRIAHAIERIVDAEYEDEDEGQAVYDEVVERLDEDRLAPDFLEQPVDVQIERLCREFGLPISEGPPEQHSVLDPESPPAARPDSAAWPARHEWRHGPPDTASPQPP